LGIIAIQPHPSQLYGTFRERLRHPLRGRAERDPARAEVLARAPAVIAVRDAAKSFRLPHELYVTFKERVVHPFRRYSYDRLPAVRGVTFDVRRGEFFGIVGRNGSGKSTLLRCIAGIYDLDAGEIEVRGRVSPFIELGAGVIADLPAADTVVANMVMLGQTRRQAVESVEPVLKFAELQEFRDLPVKNYSSGMRTRLTFSIGLQAGGDILLIDEVLAVGDVSFQQKCLEEFHRMKREGRTTLFVTHDMAIIERFCDRAMLIDHGEIVEIGDPERIAREYEDLNLGSRDGHRTGLPQLRPARARAGEPMDGGRTAARLVEHPEGPPSLGRRVRHLAALTTVLARTEFKLKYLGSVLGYLWSLLRPLMMFGVLYLLLTQLFPFGRDVTHYPVYLLGALVLWTYFSEATSSAVASLVRRRGLLQKASFPRMVVPLSAVLAAMFNLAMNLLAVFVFVLAAGISPDPRWLELVPLVLFLVLLTTGLALLLSALYVRYRDVGQIWAMALQMLFYGSPILYVVSRLPDSVEQILAASPLALVLTGMRHALIDPTAPTIADAAGGYAAVLVPIGIVAGVLALGTWAFNREAPRIVERL
jgi:ABC-type polysaccharide/polyol phosphate transport system ATPase subunit/ABC-type polysaccharide/polyol phosphate export permease